MIKIMKRMKIINYLSKVRNNSVTVKATNYIIGTISKHNFILLTMFLT